MARVRIALLGFVVGACRIGFEPQAIVDDASLGSPDGSERCPNGRGPAMSLVTAGFCIDNTEVTKAQYQAFLDTSPAVKTDGRCSYNTSYVPRDYVWAATTNDDQAVAGADWCDARDFCEWSGKRLCGRIGGGSLAYNEHAAADAQWFAACSQNAGKKHPYATDVDDAAKPWCHLDDSNNATGHQAVVGAYPMCRLVGTNVYDLLGNLQEWVDVCETTATNPATDRCKVVGGVWYFGSSYVNCSFFDTSMGNHVPRNAGEKHIGFRCCAD